MGSARGREGGKEFRKVSAVNEGNGVIPSEGGGRCGETAGGDEDRVGGLFRGEHPEEFADRLNTDREGFPVFALDEGDLAGFVQANVDAAVAGRGADDLGGIALAAIGLGDELFEVLPGELADLFKGCVLFEATAVEELGEFGDEPGDEDAEGNEK